MKSKNGPEHSGSLEEQLESHGMISMPEPLRDRVRGKVRQALRRKTFLDDCKLVAGAFAFVVFAIATCWVVLSNQQARTEALLGSVPTSVSAQQNVETFSSQ